MCPRTATPKLTGPCISSLPRPNLVAPAKGSPELFAKLLLGDELSSARSTSPSSGSRAVASLSSAAPSEAAPGRLMSATARVGSANAKAPPLGRAPPTGGPGGLGLEAPRFGEEPLSEEQMLALELESVKREREGLIASIQHVKSEAGK